MTPRDLGRGGGGERGRGGERGGERERGRGREEREGGGEGGRKGEGNAATEVIGQRLHPPSLFTMYLPKKPVAPKTVATIPLKEDLPPDPRFVKELT